MGADMGRVCADSADDGAVFVGTVATFKTTCKTKVDDFDVKIFVKQNVLGLEIAMGEAFLVDIVQTLQHLLKVVFADSL